MSEQLVLTANFDVAVDVEYKKKPHVFQLIVHDGDHHVRETGFVHKSLRTGSGVADSKFKFQAESDEDMHLWLHTFQLLQRSLRQAHADQAALAARQKVSERFGILGDAHFCWID